MYELLDQIQSPEDLRNLSKKQLPQLAQELRDFIVESVSQTGGHFASNLGCVELTVALHYVFNTPYDRLVWDVGHQTYPHKILTGRKDQMHTMRQRHGLAGFPKREESEFDTFGVGHSSTSISAAQGMAEGAKLAGEDRKAIAIIGDGAMTAGMAFEALNNAGCKDTDLLVILNDNDMSISPNVGALNTYLAKLMSGKFYAAFKNTTGKVLDVAPPLKEFARKSEEHVKGFFTPSTLFEAFGFNYIGPIDGHDLDALIPTLQNIRSLKGPQFLHIVTKKGQGYKLAEKDPVAYHGVSKFDPANGLTSGKSGGKQTYTQVFSDWLCDMAAQDEKLVGITPAMREGSGLVAFEQAYPDRYFDVGIAEQHALTFAAGLACEGRKPVVAIYSTFLQRAYDQLIHDIALQDLDVTLAIDRAGLVGADGPTHAGAFDLSFMRCIPGISILAPSNEAECRQMLTTAYLHKGTTAVRYPRGTGPGVEAAKTLEPIEWGKAEQLRSGEKVAILAFGSKVTPAKEVAETLNATLVNMRFIKPLDIDMVNQIALTHTHIVTIEENVVAGGAGSAVLEALVANGHCKDVLMLGLPDQYVEHGDHAKLLAECGLDAQGILTSILKRLATQKD